MAKSKYSLQGDITVRPTAKTMKLKVGDTIALHGVGNNLSSNYVILEIKTRIDKDSGLSLTFTVIKDTFGKTLKKPVAKKGAYETKKGKLVSFKLKDKVKITGKNATYSKTSNGSYSKVPAKVKKKKYTITKFNLTEDRAYLSGLNKWVMTRYLKHA
jgi:hypothetical protein